MSAPSVSVVIPAYNYGHLVERAVDSALSQTLPPAEVVVVDDGSTDDTLAVLSRYEGREGGVPVRVFTGENRGPAAARNRGIGEASGTFVLPLDADDELLPDAVETLVAALEDGEADLVVGGCLSVTPDGRTRTRSAPAFLPEREANFRAYLEKRIALSHGRMLVRRALLSEIRYPEHLRSAEDIPVFAQLMARALPRAADRPVARIHHHGDSLRHDPLRAAEAGLKVVDALFDPALLDEACMAFRDRYYVNRCLSLFRTAYRAGDHDRAATYYHRAVGASPSALFRFSYLT